VSRPTAAPLLLAAALSLAAPALGAPVRDAAGRAVEVGVPAQRILSLAPNITEILFALGLGDRVVGVTDYCDYPPAALAKPRIGGFVNPSIEAIVVQRPDLVVATTDGNRPEDVATLERLGIAVYVVQSHSIADIRAAIEAVGALTGAEARARAVNAELERRLARIRAAVGGLAPVSVFVALDRAPLITAGPGTFVDELVTLAGGRNVAAASPIRYPVFSIEQLLAADPRVILDAAEVRPIGPAEAAGLWRALPGAAALTAVREGRITEVNMGSFFRPGPRILDTLERMVELLHPGALPR
jgi:iron complex transport system substrate-binding protein